MERKYYEELTKTYPDGKKSTLLMEMRNGRLYFKSFKLSGCNN